MQIIARNSTLAQRRSARKARATERPDRDARRALAPARACRDRAAA